MYVALIHKDAESDFGVSFPDLPGCVSAGVTVDEALSEARIALALHIEGLKADGDPVPAPRSIEALLLDAEFVEDKQDALLTTPISPTITSGVTKRINVSIDTGQLALIDQAAGAAGMNRSAYLINAALTTATG